MKGTFRVILILAAILWPAFIRAADDDAAPPPLQLVISVAEQKLALVRDGGLVRKYPVSTSKFGLGDAFNSYRTPLGRLRVCDKIGDDLPIGAVFKCRNATGEILPANAPGRDPIVTRILWLEGLEPGNANARGRGIYIHGTVEESKLGQPMSYGCIRMRSRDVVELFEDVPVGTPVEIIEDRFPRFRKFTPKTETLFAAKDSIITTVGPRGMVVVRTVRNTGPMAAAKPAPATPASESTRLTVAKLTSAKPAAPEEVAKSTLKTPTTPADDGPRLVFATTAATKRHPIPPEIPVDEPRVVLNMSSSMLMADFAPASKPPAPAQTPASLQPAAPLPPEPEPAPVVYHFIALDIASISFALSDDEAGALPIIDALTQSLLEPPTAPIRLAQRAQ